MEHISLAHGNGGRLMRDLIEDVFARHLGNPGLDVPGDVEIVGVDGTEAGAHLQPALTSIAQDRRTLVTRAVEMLLAMQNGDGDGEPERILVPTRLVVRDSA